MADLNGRNVAVIVTNGFEDSEFSQPVQALRENGAKVTVITDNELEIEGENGLSVSADAKIENVSADDFHALVIPGGVKNPDTMRLNEKAINFVRDFFKQHKPVAAICHGPWLLVEAGVVDGRTLTSWPSLKTDIINAGGNWVDEEVVVDEGLVTSRKPDDLKAFCAKVVEEISEGKHSEQKP